MLIGVLIRGECEIPGRSIYKLEQSILKIAGDYRTIKQGRTTYSFLFFWRKKMVQSATIKQDRLANFKHTYFFFGLSGSYSKSSQIKVSHLFNIGGCIALSADYF